ncbi:hypothetical protein [Leeuwenhoekiella sp. UBA6783]|uniref:hypothetical protein n=1 Tax=Leeuwenhoekiella sp. UBA6783 TaxID=1946747 RepID=UPI0025BC2741|nr:hypothetical protein [Leeuwenhoekiella sp. UBA6783]
MKEKVVVFLLFFYGVYYDLLGSLLPNWFNFSDELITIFLLPYILANPVLLIKSAKLKRVLFFLVTILLLGYIGFLVYEYQSLKITFLAGINYVKSYVSFFFICSFLYNRKFNLSRFILVLKRHFYFSLLIIILGVFYQLLFDKASMRYFGFLPQISSFFDPIASYGIVMIFLGLVYFFLNSYSKVPKIVFFSLVLLIVLSLRVKSMVFLGVLIIFLYGGLRLFNVRNLIILSFLIFLGLSVAPLASLFNQKLRDSFVVDKDTGRTARAVLYLTSPRVAIDHFPYGTGFGTYGTHYSAAPYSPLYREYNMASVYGLHKNEPIFVNDTQWPPILVEIGCIGLLFYVLLLRAMYKFTSSFVQDDQRLKKVVWLAFILLFVNSLGMPVFFNSTSSAIYCLLGICAMLPTVNFKRSLC